MFNFNTFQPNVNIFVKSNDLRRSDRKKSLNFFSQNSGSL